MLGAPCSTFSRAQHDAARKDEAAGHARNVSPTGLSGQALGLSRDAAAEPGQPSGSQELLQGQTSQLPQQVPGVPSLEEPPPRRLDRAGAAVRRALSEGAQDDRPGTRRRTLEPLIVGDRTIDVLASELCRVHPLVKAVNWSQQDIADGNLIEPDHGSWDGRWTRPSRWEFEAMEATGSCWPSGNGEHEALTTAAQGKDLRWSEMDEGTRDKFRTSAVDQWNKFVENKAVKVLTLEESKAVMQELKMKGEEHNVC